MRHALFAFPLLFCACAAINASPAARAQEAANELNLNTKFGRMEMAAERVAPKAKEQFYEHHKGWGGKVRVADYELAGMKMNGDDTAEVVVKVAWFVIDEGDLRTTTLRQKWKGDIKGDWKMVEEARVDGDLGLLGEKVEAPAAAKEPAKRRSFPTIHIGNAGPNPPEELPGPPSEAASKATSAP
jgi:hypothetical protein